MTIVYRVVIEPVNILNGNGGENEHAETNQDTLSSVLVCRQCSPGAAGEPEAFVWMSFALVNVFFRVFRLFDPDFQPTWRSFSTSRRLWL